MVNFRKDIVVIFLLLFSVVFCSHVIANTLGCENNHTSPYFGGAKGPQLAEAESPRTGNNYSFATGGNSLGTTLFTDAIFTGIEAITGQELGNAGYNAILGLWPNSNVSRLNPQITFSNRSKAYDSPWGHLWGLNIDSYLLVNKENIHWETPTYWTIPIDWTVEVIQHEGNGAGINNPVFQDNHPDAGRSNETWYHDYQPDFEGIYNTEYPLHLTALNSFNTYGLFGIMPNAVYGDWYRVDDEVGKSYFYCDPLDSYAKFVDVQYYTGKAYLKEIRDAKGNRTTIDYIYHAATDEYYPETIKQYSTDFVTAVQEISMVYTEFEDGYLRVTAMVLFPDTEREQTVFLNHMHDAGEGDLGKWIMCLIEYPDGTWGVNDTGIDENGDPYFEFMDPHSTEDRKARYVIGDIVEGQYSGNGGIYRGQTVYSDGDWITRESREHIGDDNHIQVTSCNGRQENWLYDAVTGQLASYSNNRGKNTSPTYPGPQMSDISYENGRTRHYHYDSVDREDGLHVIRVDFEDGSYTEKTYFKWVQVDYGAAYEYAGGNPLHYHDYHDSVSCTHPDDPYHWVKRMYLRSERDRDGNEYRYHYFFENQATFIEDVEQAGVYIPSDPDFVAHISQTYIRMKQYPDGTFEEWTYYSTGIHTGFVKTYTDKSGKTYEYLYDDNGYVSSVIIGEGDVDTISVTYTENGYIEEVLDYVGRSVKTHYNEMDQVILIEYSDGTIEEYEYYNECATVPQDPTEKAAFIGLLQDQDNPLGRTGLLKWKTNRYCPVANELFETETPIYTWYDYDENDKVIEVLIKDSDNNIHEQITYEYDPDTLELLRQEDNSSTIAYTYDSAGRISRIYRLVETDVEAPIPDVSGIWKTTYIEYDEYDRVSLREEYYTRNGIDDTIRKRVHFEYDAPSRLESILTVSVDENGIEHSIAFIKKTYNRRGNVIKVERLIEGDPETGQYAVTEAQFNSAGLMTKMINPDLTEKRWWYDENNNVIQRRNEEGHDFYKEYDNLNRLVREYGQVSGGGAGFDISHQYTVNAYIGTVIKRTINNINNGWQEETCTKNKQVFNLDKSVNKDVGILTSSMKYTGDGKLIHIEEPSGSVLETEYDPLRRVLKTIRNGDTIKTYAYNEVPGNYESRFAGSSCGQVISLTDASGNTSKRIFDGLDRLAKTVDANGNSTTLYHDKYVDYFTMYDGTNNQAYVTEVIPQVGAISRYYKDMLGRDIRRESGVDQVSEKIYTIGGALDATAAFNNSIAQVTEYAYNVKGLLMDIVYPDGGKVSYSYYPDGQIQKVMDQKYQEATFTRDQLDRITVASFANQIQVEELRNTYDFDDSNNKIIAKSYIDGILSTEARQYMNNDGQMLQERQQHYLSSSENNQEIIDYNYYLSGWDGGGNLKYLYSANRERIQYQYDSNNRLEKLYRTNDGKRIAKLAYNDNYTTAKVVRGNNLETQYTYDNTYNLTRSRTLDSTGTVFNLEYGYNGVNQVVYEDNTTDSSWDETYEYDELGRITDYKRGWFNGTSIETPHSESTWTLDSLRNWTDFIVNGITETRSHNEVNEVTTINSTSISWDANGNLTDDGQYLYEWNIANQLTAVRDKVTNSLVNENIYDALGRKVWEINYTTAVPEETDFFYTGNQVIEERINNGTSTVTYNYIWGQYVDELICRFETTTSGYEDIYPISNRQNSTYRTYDGDGDLIEKYRYTPYGGVEFFDAQGTALNNSQINMRYLFTGREYNPATGLYYFRARYYSSHLGRFISKDPLGYIDGYNLYAAYFPPGSVDPSGMAFEFVTNTIGSVTNTLTDVLDATLVAGIDVVAGMGEGVTGFLQGVGSGDIDAAFTSLVNGLFDGPANLLGSIGAGFVYQGDGYQAIFADYAAVIKDVLGQVGGSLQEVGEFCHETIWWVGDNIIQPALEVTGGPLIDYNGWWKENTQEWLPTWGSVLDHWQETDSLSLFYKIHTIITDNMGIDSPADWLALALSMGFGSFIDVSPNIKPLITAFFSGAINVAASDILNTLFGTPERFNASYSYNPIPGYIFQGAMWAWPRVSSYLYATVAPYISFPQIINIRW